MPTKIRVNRITFKLVATVVVLLFVSHALLVLISGVLVRGDMIKHGGFENRSEVQEVADFVGEALAGGWNMETIGSALKLKNGRQRAWYVYDSVNQAVLFGVESQTMTFKPGAGFFRSALELQPPDTSLPALTEYDGQEWFVAAAAVPESSGRSGLKVVNVSPAFKPDFNRWNRQLLYAAGLSLALGILFVLITSKLITRRLKYMIDAARKIAKGNFNQQVPVGSKDELGELAATLNRMAEELGSLDRMRKDFIANVSHDLRSPLTSIHGYVGALQDGTIPPEQAQRYLTIIKGQTKRLIRLVNDLLDMGKVDSGQFTVVSAPFNLSETIRRALARMEPQFAHHRVVFRIDSPDGEDVYAIGDADRIEQVLHNLVQNAVEFADPGQDIQVFLRKERRAIVTVMDKGIGIDPEELDRIWDRFYKSDRARSKKNGTGIGLSIVKAILDRHDSEIKVESAIGQGTAITFSLPLAVPPHETHRPNERLPETK
ncbi:HAMP domain-containing sensor histidine kinase [Paenibacillus sp. CECT 9249]|uniref:sensor histidine kinase n=1 Tax=Paenibacillus sp. CECT 9249 TaxID=2845385 RepID=UPI001E540F10|nr:HAMP domain-containing sensor histidine kinase [Paenibacillus sp. CECT 9249]